MPTALLGVREDTLTPPWQLSQLRSSLAAPCSLEEISSIYGHDAFLKEVDAMSGFIARALQGEVRRAA